MHADGGPERPAAAMPEAVDEAGIGDGATSAPAGSSAPPPHLTLYGRGWCHLCDDMKAALISLLAGKAFVLHEVDVDADPAIEDRFGDFVPVLLAGTPDESGEQLCHYFLDADRVVSWLETAAA